MIHYRNTKGLTFIEIIFTVAIITIVFLAFPLAVKLVMNSMIQDRQEISANNFSQLIINELKSKCAPIAFVSLEEESTNDWEVGRKRKYEVLRASVTVGNLQSNGQREVKIEIFPHAVSSTLYKKYEYTIILVKNPGLTTYGIVSGYVKNYVTDRGIPGALVSGPNAKIGGLDVTCYTKSNGSFKLLGVKIGDNIPITISKLGSTPNDLNYEPGYYFDPDLIYEDTMQPKNTTDYENPDRSNDSLCLTNTFKTEKNKTIDIGTAYLCPMAIIRGWVREDENDAATGIGKIVVGIYRSGNFNTQALDPVIRSSLHPYYGTRLISLKDDVNAGIYFLTTSNGTQDFTYHIEGTAIPFTLNKGEYVFFNVRPGLTVPNMGISGGGGPCIRAHGRCGSDPTVTQYIPPDSTDSNDLNPNFEWGYLRSTFIQPGSSYLTGRDRDPRIHTKTSNCFDATGGAISDILPYINEQSGHHNMLPVANSLQVATNVLGNPLYTYKFYGYGACNHTYYHNFSYLATEDTDMTNDTDPVCGNVSFNQYGWDNYESMGWPTNKDYPTCFVARRRGGIKGRIVDSQTGLGIKDITVRAKSWADTDDTFSWPFTRTFNAACPTVTTDAQGDFYLYNLYGKEQQFYATSNAPISNWGFNAHIDDITNACLTDITIQDFAVLRLTDDPSAPGYSPRQAQYMPRLIRPHHNGAFDHKINVDAYPFSSWHPSNKDNNKDGTLGTGDDSITDFGTIALINITNGVTVTGYLQGGGIGVNNATVETISIHGLSANPSYNANLGMNHNTSITQTVTFTGGPRNQDGYFILNNVMPNFILINPPDNNNNRVPNYTQNVWQNFQNYPRWSLQQFVFEGPPAQALAGVTLTGRVYDQFNNINIDGASVELYLYNPTNNQTSQNNPHILTNSGPPNYLAGTGGYGFQNIGFPGTDAVPIIYHEHLPATHDNTVDPYINVGWPRQSLELEPWDPNFVNNRTIALGTININLAAADRNIMLYAFNAPGYENGWSNVALVAANNTYTVDIILGRIYTVRLFGSVEDDKGNPLSGCQIDVYTYDRFLPHQNTSSNIGGDTTNAQGYWGDWTPEIGIPYGLQIETDLYPANNGSPQWDIRVRVYKPANKTLASGLNYQDTLLQAQPTGWHSYDPLTYTYEVHFDTIKLTLVHLSGT